MSLAEDRARGLSWRELTESAPDPARADELLRELQRAQLVSVTDRSDDSRTVRLVHQCLAEQWNPLVDWREEERERLTWSKRLNGKVNEWINLNRSCHVGLLNQRELLEAEELLSRRRGKLIGVNPEIVQLVRLSRRALQRKRTIITSVSTAAVVVLAVTAGFAAYQWDRATKAQGEARQLLRLMQAAYAARLIEQSQPLEEITNNLVNLLESAAAAAPGDRQRLTKENAQLLEQVRSVRSEEIAGYADAKARTITEFKRYNTKKWKDLSAARKQSVVDSILNKTRAIDDSETALRMLLYAVAAIPDNEGALNTALREAIRSYRLRDMFSRPSGSQVWAVAFDRQKKYRVAVGGNDGSINIWEPRIWSHGSGSQELSTANKSTEIVNGITINSSGTLLAAALRSDGAIVWDLATNTIKCRLASPRGEEAGGTDSSLKIYDVAFVPNSDGLAVATSDNAAYLWDVGKDGCPRVDRKFAHRDDVFGIAISRDGKLLATASGDGTAAVWNLGDQKASEPYREFPPDNKGDAVFAVAFSPSGQTIAAAGADGLGRVWDIASGKAVASLPRHEGMVGRITFSPDGSLIATAGADGRVMVSAADTGELKYTFTHRAAVFGVVFSDNSKYLVTGGLDGTAMLWSMEGNNSAADAAKDWKDLVALGAARLKDRSTLRPNECATILSMQIPALEMLDRTELSRYSCPPLWAFTAQPKAGPDVH